MIAPIGNDRQWMDWIQEWVFVPLEKKIEREARQIRDEIAQVRKGLYWSVSVSIGIATILIMIAQLIVGITHR